MELGNPILHYATCNQDDGPKLLLPLPATRDTKLQPNSFDQVVGQVAKFEGQKMILNPNAK